MSWTDSINQGLTPIPFQGCTLEVLHWAYSPHLPDNVPHRHTYFEICFVGEYGGGIFTVRDEDFRLAPGDLFIARPGVIHQIRNDRGNNMELYWVSFLVSSPRDKGGQSASTEHRDLFRAFADSSRLVVPDSSGCLRALWQGLRASASMPARAGHHAITENIMSALLLAIGQAGAGDLAPRALGLPGKNEKLVARLAVRYVHDNLDRRIPISEIADHVHVSSRHLTRLFVEFTGVPPATYIEQARMSRAVVLLRDTAIPIKTVAMQVGYPDVHQFTRAFRRHNDMAPAAYRKSGSVYRPYVTREGQLV